MVNMYNKTININNNDMSWMYGLGGSIGMPFGTDMFTGSIFGYGCGGFGMDNGAFTGYLVAGALETVATCYIGAKGVAKEEAAAAATKREAAATAIKTELKQIETRLTEIPAEMKVAKDKSEIDTNIDVDVDMSKYIDASYQTNINTAKSNLKSNQSKIDLLNGDLKSATDEEKADIKKEIRALELEKIELQQKLDDAKAAKKRALEKVKAAGEKELTTLETEEKQLKEKHAELKAKLEKIEAADEKDLDTLLNEADGTGLSRLFSSKGSKKNRLNEFRCGLNHLAGLTGDERKKAGEALYQLGSDLVGTCGEPLKSKIQEWLDGAGKEFKH